jgi:hypothetical protein
LVDRPEIGELIKHPRIAPHARSLLYSEALMAPVRLCSAIISRTVGRCASWVRAAHAAVFGTAAAKVGGAAAANVANDRDRGTSHGRGSGSGGSSGGGGGGGLFGDGGEADDDRDNDGDHRFSQARGRGGGGAAASLASSLLSSDDEDQVDRRRQVGFRLLDVGEAPGTQVRLSFDSDADDSPGGSEARAAPSLRRRLAASDEQGNPTTPTRSLAAAFDGAA